MKSILMGSAGVTKDIALTLAQLSATPSTGWVNDPETGLYNTAAASYVAGYYPANGYKQCPMTGIDLSKIKKFSAKFTLYYNTPANCIAFNIFRLTLSNSQQILVGVMDQNTDASQGIYYANGAVSASQIKNTDFVDHELSYTVPDNLSITKIEWCSAAYSNFARSKNGMKEAKVLMR